MAGGEPRFGMLETIKEYALDRLGVLDDVSRVRRLHAVHYLALAEQAHRALLGPEQRRWLERLDADRGNVRAALAWALETGAVDIGLRSASALWRYWQLRGAIREGREILERLLELPTGSDAVRAVAESRVASLALMQGDHDAVQRFGESSLSRLRLAGDVGEQASLLSVMSVSALSFGDGQRARLLAEEGIVAARQSGDPMQAAYADMGLGVVSAWHGDLEEAERLLQESVLAANRLGNVRSVANWSRILGGVVHSRGDSESAQALIEESLALHRTLEDPWGTSHALSSLALVMVGAGDRDAVLRLVGESASIERDVGDLPGLVFNLEICARLAASEGRLTRAVRLYACAGGLGKTMGFRRHSSEVDWIDRDRDISELRAGLGEEAFDEAWERGRAMTMDEALDEALADE
jgi:tetratricopeptide (TPR) repeat protein